jgi:hypothetical protein
MTSQPPQALIEAATQAAGEALPPRLSRGVEEEAVARAVLAVVWPLAVAEGYQQGYQQGYQDGGRQASVCFEPEAIAAEARSEERRRVLASIRTQIEALPAHGFRSVADERDAPSTLERAAVLALVEREATP